MALDHPGVPRRPAPRPWFIPSRRWAAGDAAAEEARRTRWTHLPSAAMAAPRMLDPREYDADPPLLDAVHSAILLGQPLLVTGEPGCGKTEVANFIAFHLGLERPDVATGRPEYALRFDTKSTTTARDLFYSFDTVGRFHAARSDDPGADDPRRFITFNALGRAVLDACPPDRVVGLSGRNWTAPEGGPRRSVVLIDEIDKAPRDVPNDLLMEVERLAFYVPELDRHVQADDALRPIVVLTSNSERVLPDAFLRRCVFHTMSFPDEDRLRRIVRRRMAGLPADGPLLDDAVRLFLALREEGLRKPPGTAELLGFLAALRDLGFDPDAGLSGQAGWQGAARATMLKTVEDQRQFGDKALGDLAG
ncbi:AAA family ATPase [Dankookia sp. GCM10030260]|uniref:AAA family ATPase n=1 Tax=Dankookia sp. GCM10030260 TaxID=3273390 RepID=UPI0036240475